MEELMTAVLVNPEERERVEKGEVVVEGEPAPWL